MAPIPRHDGTVTEGNAASLLARLPLQVGHVLSASVSRAPLPLLPMRVNVVGSHGVAMFRRWSGLSWGTQIQFGDVEAIELDEQFLVRGGESRGVLHHFDFLGRFGRVRISGAVDAHGRAVDSAYHFGMAALRAFRRYSESRQDD